MINVLIIDDDQAMCRLLSQIVIQNNGSPIHTQTISEGMRLLASGWFDLVFLDVGLPDGNGLNYIPEIKTNQSAPEVIIITGKGEKEGAKMAINSGAWDYINKPFSVDRITLQLKSIAKYRADIEPVNTSIALKRDDIIGHSATLQECLTLLSDASNSDANVLITGETGTGKELFAKAIHENSRRSKKKFVVVDCGSLTESLVGSILFGHQKGAFTSADKKHDGLITLAHGGTLFLDEIGELPITIQSAFLRVLQEKKVRPLGSTNEQNSDFRLITATSRDSESMARDGLMRKDLLYRLKTMTIELPPLRERKGDVKDLAIYYTKKYCDHYGLQVKQLSTEIMDMMTDYHWPGNVRELCNAIEKAVCSARSNKRLYPIHLPSSVRVQSACEPFAVGKMTSEKAPSSSAPEGEPLLDFNAYIQQSERRYFDNLIQITNGNISEILHITKISRSRLYERLKTYGLSLK